MAFPQNIWILWLLILVSLVMITIKLESKPGEKLYTTNWHTVLACLYTADVILLVYMFMRIHAKRKRTTFRNWYRNAAYCVFIIELIVFKVLLCEKLNNDTFTFYQVFIPLWIFFFVTSLHCIGNLLRAHNKDIFPHWMSCWIIHSLICVINIINHF